MGELGGFCRTSDDVRNWMGCGGSFMLEMYQDGRSE
jgi:hypothetical protein